MENLSQTAKNTFELVARVKALTQAVAALAAEVGADTDGTSAEELPDVVTETIKTKFDTAVDDLNRRADLLATAISDLGRQHDTDTDTLNTAVDGLRARIDAVADATDDLRARAAAAEEAIAMLLSFHVKEIFAAGGAEAVRKYCPDVIAICEPENAIMTIYNQQSRNDWVKLRAVNGVIALTAEQKQAVADWERNLIFNSVRDCLYLNVSGFNRFSPLQSTLLEDIIGEYTTLTAEERSVMLEHVGQIVGMESLKSENWMLESDQGTVNGEGSSALRFAPEVTFDGDWDLHNVDRLDVFWWTELAHVRFNLPRSIDISGVRAADSSIEVIALQMFRNVDTLRYPDLDLTGIDCHPRLVMYIPSSSVSSSLRKYFHDFTPEQPQKGVFKNLGHTLPPAVVSGSYGYLYAQFELVDWDHDDMVATLITHSHSLKSRYGKNYTGRISISRASYDRLSATERANIAAKGYTLVVNSNIPVPEYATEE